MAGTVSSLAAGRAWEPWVVDSFVADIDHAFRDAQEAFAEVSDRAGDCLTSCPITGESVDISFGTYADDAIKTLVLTEASASELSRRSLQYDVIFSEALEPQGYNINKRKNDTMPCPTGVGSKIQKRLLIKNTLGQVPVAGKMADVVRHLGARTTVDLSFSAELEANNSHPVCLFCFR